MQKKVLKSKHILLTEFNFSDLFSIDLWMQAREKFNEMHPFAFKLIPKNVGISAMMGLEFIFLWKNQKFEL